MAIYVFYVDLESLCISSQKVAVRLMVMVYLVMVMDI